MILFHVWRLDSGDLRLWRRVLLPAYLLRRAGLPVRVIAGAVKTQDFAGAQTMLAAGQLTPDTARHCRQAREAGLRVVLDIGDSRALSGDLAPLRSAVAAAHGLTVADAMVAEIAAERLGPMRPPISVLPDLPAGRVTLFRLLVAFPTAGFALLADGLKIRAIDLVRRLRRWILAPRRMPHRRPLIVWFGDAAGLNEEGGLGELLLAAGALVDLAEDVPYRLRVVGASRLQFRRTIARLPIVADFRRLTLATLAWDIKGADLCLLPAAGDRPDRARTDARAAIARRLGIPIIAPPLNGGDWERVLRQQLADHVTSVVSPEDEALPRLDGVETLQAWRRALTAAQEDRHVVSSAPAVPGGKRLRVLFLLQQFQDLDLICPIAEAATDSADMEVHVAVLTKIAVPASRRLGHLRRSGATINFWQSRDVATGRIGLSRGAVDAAVTASDGSGPGSRYAVAFVRAANAIGVPTLNLQHGLDNGGLTYGEPNPHRKEQFASRFVLTWGGFDRLTSSANADTRAKVIPAGCPKRRLPRTQVPDLPVTGRTIIAVFENLHWQRYSETYRQRFVLDLIATARAAPDLLFLLKPHMGGRWFTQTRVGQERTDGVLPSNLVVANPDLPPWRKLTADAFLAQAVAVITTPSTIALDAARYDLPTALVAYGIEADNYAPLPRLEQAEDWTNFVQQVRSGNCDMTRVRAFGDAAMLPGDAVARCLAVIRLAAKGCSQAEIVAQLGMAPGPA